MRKFFKSLAVLLALTLIVGVIPAAAADSLSMAKEKTLYLDGSKGTKEDGSVCKISYKKKVANMIKGFDADTMTVVLNSADKKIVKANNNTGRIYAKSIGTTTVTVAVLDASETEIFKQDLKVKVKKNATDVTVTGIADGDSFKVGQTVEVTLPRAGVDTDERDLTVDKADNVEIKAGEKARVWSVKFLKAGELTFTAKAFQSTTYPGTTKDKAIKVTVANPAPTAVKVVASNAYELTFDTDVEAAGLFKAASEIANDACYYMLNDTKVTFSAVKEVKATGNTVKVTMYDNFASGTEYFVVINGSDPMSLSVAGTGAKDVASIAILSTTAVVNTAAEIKIALYNKDGVEITESVKAEGKFDVKLTSTNLNSYVDGVTLNMYNVGDVTDLTATFTYYDANKNYEAITKTATQKITAIAPASDIYAGLVYTIDNRNTESISKWYGNTKNYIALGDTGYFFKVFFKFTNSGNEDGFEVGNDGGKTFNGKTLYAKVPEESVALISGYVPDMDGAASAATAGGYGIAANTEGKTNVFIGYDDNGVFKTVAVAPIEVKAKRVPTSLTVAPNKSNLNTTGIVGDEIKITAEIKDQYGDAFPAVVGNLKSEQNTQSAGDATFVPAWQATSTPGKFEAFANSGNVSFQTKADGSLKDSANIVFTTKYDHWEAKTPVVGTNFSAKTIGGQDVDKQPVAFTNGGASTLDTTISGTTVWKQANLQASTSNNGYFTGNVAFDAWVATAPTVATVATSGATEFQLLIKKNGSAVTANDDFLTVTPGTGNITLKNFAVSGSAISKLNGGNACSYTFTVYKIARNNGKVVISSQTLVVAVTANQTNVAFTQKAEKSVSPAAPTDAFEFSFAGTTYAGTAATSWDVSPVSGSTNAQFVKSAQIPVNVQLKDEISWGANKSVTYTLPSYINKLIKAK